MNETKKRTEKWHNKADTNNNKYDTTILNKINWTNDEQEHNEGRWAKFMYVGRQTKCITKLFKNSNLKVSLKTKNTIGTLLTQDKNINPNKFNKCGVYQLTCHDCNRKNIGQTDRSFHVRIQEHFWDFKYCNGKCKFAQYLLGKDDPIMV
jgi:hypothetical protein